MAIPKVIYQTFKNNQLPLITQWQIKKLKQRNPEYQYEFYDDDRIAAFVLDEFGPSIFDLYIRINIGAAKADFFRYAILLKKGGIYLDIDSLSITKLDQFILPTDSALVSLENNSVFYVQWALIYKANHPFLKKTMEIVIDNLKQNRFPNDVHKMTGPSAYTEAIRECLKSSPNIPYKEMGIDYEGKFKFHYRFSKLFLYGLYRKNHWKNQQNVISILRD